MQGDGQPGRASPGLAALAFRKPGGRSVTTGIAGLAQVEPTRRMTLTSPMRVASISKLVTAFGFMRLIEAGRIGLDDDVSDHLGFALRHPEFRTEVISPRRLLSHTSGLRNGPSYPVPFGRQLQTAFTPGGEHWDDGAWFGPATQPPGRWFQYADVNFALVAQLIERVSGQRFDLYMREHVFGPLGLTCGFNWSGVPQTVRDQHAVLYRKAQSDAGPFDPNGPWIVQQDGHVPLAPEIMVTRSPEAKDWPVTRYQPGENGFVFSPQGGLRASARDLEVLARVLAGQGRYGTVALLKPETIRLMAQPVWRRRPDATTGDGYDGVMRAYGLGLQTLLGEAEDDFFEGCQGWIGHLGEAYGLLSGLWVDPRQGRGFVYLISGQAQDLTANKGRSGLTWQEEQLASALTARLT